MDLPLPPADVAPLVWLAQHPEVLPALIARHNALARLEVSVVVDGVAGKGVLQESGSSAVIRVVVG